MLQKHEMKYCRAERKEILTGLLIRCWKCWGYWQSVRNLELVMQVEIKNVLIAALCIVERLEFGMKYWDYEKFLRNLNVFFFKSQTRTMVSFYGRLAHLL